LLSDDFEVWGKKVPAAFTAFKGFQPRSNVKLKTAISLISRK
jgi:hypothetical protein